MASRELSIGYPSGRQIKVRVETRDGEQRILIGWREPNGKPSSQELWLSVKEAPSVLRTVASFAEGLQ